MCFHHPLQKQTTTTKIDKQTKKLKQNNKQINKRNHKKGKEKKGEDPRIDLRKSTDQCDETQETILIPKKNTMPLFDKRN